MLKNLKSLFIIEEEENKPEQSTGKSEAQSSTSSAATPSQASSQVRLKKTGEISEKIMEKLLGVIEKNNLEGFDYIEYKKALNALSKMPMDEKTRFMSAFATANTMGATLEKLNGSIGHYKKILESEHQEFLKTIESQISQKVGEKEKMVTDIEKAILEKSEEIKRLTEEISVSQKKIQETKLKIEKDKGNIDSTKLDFEKTYAQLLSQINYDSTKINEYLV